MIRYVYCFEVTEGSVFMSVSLRTRCGSRRNSVSGTKLTLKLQVGSSWCIVRRAGTGLQYNTVTRVQEVLLEGSDYCVVTIDTTFRGDRA